MGKMKLMRNKSALTTIDQINEAYKGYLNNSLFRWQLVRYVHKVWTDGVLYRDDVRVADIYGRKGGQKERTEKKAKSQGGSVCLNVNVDSDKFFYLYEFDPNVNIASSNIIDTLLLIFLGNKKKPLSILQDLQQARMQLALHHKEFTQILEDCVTNMEDKEACKLTKLFIKFKAKAVHKKRFIQAYEYHNQDGTLYGKVEHFIIDGFKQYFGSGKITAWPLCNLKDLTSNKNITILVEGEKKVNLLRQLVGNVVFVTCLRGGAKATLQTHHISLLKNQTVYIMRDLDDAGLSFATRNHNVLSKNGIHTEILNDKDLLDLFALSNIEQHQKYDVADFILTNQDNKTELQQFLNRLGTRIK